MHYHTSLLDRGAERLNDILARSCDIQLNDTRKAAYHPHVPAGHNNQHKSALGSIWSRAKR